MNRTRFFPILLAAALLAGACQKNDLPRDYALDRTPEALRPAAADAESTIALLQRRLGARLKTELDRGGPAAAVSVCRDSAQSMTADVAAETGVAVGRTSHRLRNPGNAPREWARPFVAAVDSGTMAADVKAVVVDLGDRVGVLQPIPTAALCLRCHGSPDSLDADLVKIVRESYPQDQAVGFAENELRGFFWAEAPRR